MAGHAFAIGAVMLARGEIVVAHDRPIEIVNVPITKDPPPLPPPPAGSRPSHVTRPPLIDDAQRATADPVSPIFDPGPVTETDGKGVAITLPDPPNISPVHEIVRRGPQMATAEANLRPPYPDSKRMLGEEATLTLKLTIDERGRVVAVEPIGNADRLFLESARSHLIRAWRFAPATEDGKPVESTKVITLRFELGEA